MHFGKATNAEPEVRVCSLRYEASLGASMRIVMGDTLEIGKSNQANRRLAAGCWHGQNVAIREVAGLRLAENRYPAGYKTRKHSHNAPLFCLVQEGSLTQTYGRKTRDGHPMTLIGLAPDEVHSDSFHNRGTRVFIIEIGQSWMGRVLDQSNLLDESVDFRGGLVPWLAMRLYNEFRQPDQLSLLSIEGLTLELIAETARRYARPPERRPSRWLIQAKELLHERFSETLTLQNIAKAVDIHPVHLARGFHQCYGCTVGEYVRRRRIEFASREILLCDDPLSQIALRAGFYDQSHFSRVFKRQMGFSPAKFRAACGKR